MCPKPPRFRFGALSPRAHPTRTRPGGLVATPPVPTDARVAHADPEIMSTADCATRGSPPAEPHLRPGLEWRRQAFVQQRPSLLASRTGQLSLMPHGAAVECFDAARNADVPRQPLFRARLLRAQGITAAPLGLSFHWRAIALR